MQVAARLGQNRLPHRGAYPGNLQQVHPRYPVQMPAHIRCIGRRVLAVRARILLQPRQVFLLFARTDALINALDFRIALRHLLGIGVVHRQRLLQHEQMLFAPGAGQGLGNLFFWDGGLRASYCIQLRQAMIKLRIGL